MPAGRRYLDLCERLHKSELLKPRFEIGERLGRGFADLGAEEFQLVGFNRLVSLFTGHQSELAEKDKHFFFLIPDVDQMAAILCEQGYDIESIERPEQRQWQLRFKRADSEESLSCCSETLLEVFAQALITIS